MSLTTLANLKTTLGITGSSEDAALTLWLRQAVSIIRAYRQQYLGGMLSANTLANPTVVTAIGHGLDTGDSITIVGSNSTPTIDGTHTVTRVSDDTFTVPINVTVAGTAGYYARTFTHYFPGNGTRELPLRERPVQSIASLYLDNAAYHGDASGAFASTALLVAGTDYTLRRDGPGPEASKSGLVTRINGVWDATTVSTAGLLGSSEVTGAGNIKATYLAGYKYLPDRFQGATIGLVTIIRKGAQFGGPLASESYDYYSYQLSSATPGDGSALGSVKQALMQGREIVW